MYTLINDLWSTQKQIPYEYPIQIPQTIIIHPGFKVYWYFSKDNKILKRKQQNCTIQAIIHYLEINHIQLTLTSIQQPCQIQGFGEIQLINQPIQLDHLEQLLTHIQQFPNVIDNPIILQEHFSKGQHISLTWNRNFTFVQECDQYTFQVNKQCLKITPHYRKLIDTLCQQLVHRIQIINQDRGSLNEMKIIICLIDKPIFLWCLEMKFIHEQLVRNLENDSHLWTKIKHFKLNFGSIIKHKRCQSNFENQNNQININQSINVTNIASHRTHNASVCSNISNPKNLSTQLKSARSNICKNINIKQLLTNNSHNQSSELSTQRQSRGGSVLRQLSNRSFSNRSSSMCKVHLNDDKHIQQQQQQNGSKTQRTEPSEQDILNSVRIVHNSSKTLKSLRQKLQEIKLKDLL